MPRCLVTGAAGFIGSHLAARLVNDDWEVIGIDCFTDYYPKEIKLKNLDLWQRHGRFIQGDLNQVDLDPLLQDTDYIFHLAAQAGVRASWGDNFEVYIRNNIQATQRLLEKMRSYPNTRLVYAGTSSVYGDIAQLPFSEDAPARPISPYGVTKLAAEHLLHLYHVAYQIDYVTLRYFTVYGPGQRPDMAFHRWFKAALLGEPLTIFGDGTQTRDFTYVADIVEGTIQAALSDHTDHIFNLGGGHRVSVNDIIKMLRELTGLSFKVEYITKQKGDMTHTAADISKAGRLLGYEPNYDLEKGLLAQFEWIRQLYGS